VCAWQGFTCAASAQVIENKLVTNAANCGILHWLTENREVMDARNRQFGGRGNFARCALAAAGDEAAILN
jgi:hypothetical protein